MAQVQCQHCGAMTSDEGATCQSCGSPLGPPATQPAAASPFPTPVVGGQAPSQQPMGYARTADSAPAQAPPPQQAPAQAPPPQQAPAQAPPPQQAPAQAPPPQQAPAQAPPPQQQAPPAQPGVAPPAAWPPQSQLPATQSAQPGAPGAPATSQPYFGGTPTPLMPGQQMAKDALPLRLVAIIIDFIAIYIVASIFIGVLGFAFILAPAFFSGAIAFLYFGLLEGMQGQTLGKMALGLKVVKEDMTPITMEQAFIRAADIFLWGITVGIVALIDLVLSLDNGQRLGDRWGHTVVIKVQ